MSSFDIPSTRHDDVIYVKDKKMLERRWQKEFLYILYYSLSIFEHPLTDNIYISIYPLIQARFSSFQYLPYGRTFPPSSTRHLSSVIKVSSFDVPQGVKNTQRGGPILDHFMNICSQFYHDPP